jgi:GT2 family glycosyltransferase/glycosyltransferase involved in cell wall biosynthesis
MRQAARTAWRIFAGLPLAILSPVFLLIAALGLALADVIALFAPRKPRNDSAPRRTASIVIPNWNGQGLLESYLPSVIAAAREPGSEVIVVDNASEDKSVEVAQRLGARVIKLDRNLGFGGGSNAGVGSAKNDIVVLLNSDMRVEPDFLQPLLDGFTDPAVFAVSCQIHFTDPAKLREETGLTQGSWHQGTLRVRHRIDPEIADLYPCFYGGGGSCAFDKRKFLELGGFDHLLRPFYLEDTDLGYQAWKRGWKVLYQPRSIVYHEHRGTIGKKFTPGHINRVLKKNFLLFTWKNIHDWRMLFSHFFFTWAQAMVTWLAGYSPERSSFGGLARATLQLPGAMRSRIRACGLSTLTDREAFQRPLGGYFRDAFLTKKDRPLGVLFVSPYPIVPPVHGGAVFMYQTVKELARLVNLHAIVLLDYEYQRPPHQELDRICKTTHYIVRMEGRQRAIGSIVPYAVREFRNPDLAWLIHREIYLREIDVLQLEYTVLGQYAGGFRRIPSILFEHDVYFQSIARRLPFMIGATTKMTARWEYLRSLRYELRMLRAPDRVQVCSRDNGAYLESFLPALRGRVDDGFRAGIDTSHYEYRATGREPFTMLFLGSFRHLPNQQALTWFTGEVLPRIKQAEPRARLIVIGSDPPPRHSLRDPDAIEMIGFVEDVRTPLAQYAVFVCPILSGSGVRVKLLEAFAAGIPVVSTRLGAEGLATKDGDICALADDPQGFADRTLELLRNPERAAELARRARADVVEKRDMRRMTERMVESYRAEVDRMRSNHLPL